MEERPGEAGFTMLLEPPNEAPAKAGFGGAVLHLLLGKHNWSRVKAVLDGSRFEPRGSTGRRVHACPRGSLRVHLEGGPRESRAGPFCNDFTFCPVFVKSSAADSEHTPHPFSHT